MTIVTHDGIGTLVSGMVTFAIEGLPKMDVDMGKDQPLYMGALVVCNIKGGTRIKAESAAEAEEFLDLTSYDGKHKVATFRIKRLP